MNILCSDNNHYGHIENPIDNKKSSTNDNKSDYNNTHLQTYNLICMNIYIYNYFGYDHVYIYISLEKVHICIRYEYEQKMAVQTS